MLDRTWISKSPVAGKSREAPSLPDRGCKDDFRSPAALRRGWPPGSCWRARPDRVVPGRAAALMPEAARPSWPRVVAFGGEVMFATTIRFALTADTDWEDFRQLLVRRAVDTYRYVP